MRLIYLSLFTFFTTFYSLGLQAQSFTSANTQTSLIELYTSQGCSSCPPAEKWLNQLKGHDKLWQDFIPLAFHVDYWDYLGWNDPYANAQHSLRQRTYNAQGKTSAVYTPGFMLRGKQWDSWRFSQMVKKSSAKVGIIQAKLTGQSLNVNFSKSNSNLELNVAVLGFGIKTKIHAGENSGSKLPQEFVVLKHTKASSKNGHWKIKLPTYKKSGVKKYGLAIWINKTGDLTPIQATGGWLK